MNDNALGSNALGSVTQALASPAMRAQLEHMLPSNVPIDRFTEVTLMAIRQNPDVLQADRQTLYDACLQLARRGLLPDKKEAALVVFPTNVGTRSQPKWVKVVTQMPMVEGIIKEMGKAGVKAYAMSVYANDQIRLWNDDAGQHVLHEPIMFGDRGARVGCYAAGLMPDGRTYVEAMNNEDIAKVRARSRQKDDNGNPTGTWKTDPERMEQKSALHRLRKRIPILDDDALQNLKDMEEETDIDLKNDGLPPNRPVSEEAGSAERAESTAQASTSRRPRALQSVVDQANQTNKGPYTFVKDEYTGIGKPDPPEFTPGEYEGNDLI